MPLIRAQDIGAPPGLPDDANSSAPAPVTQWSREGRLVAGARSSVATSYRDVWHELECGPPPAQKEMNTPTGRRLAYVDRLAGAAWEKCAIDADARRAAARVVSAASPPISVVAAPAASPATAPAASSSSSSSSSPAPLVHEQAAAWSADAYRASSPYAGGGGGAALEPPPVMAPVIVEAAKSFLGTPAGVATAAGGALLVGLVVVLALR